jgi:hypothetical protein
MLSPLASSIGTWIGRFAAAAVVVGCHAVPGRAADLYEARRQFSEEVFCPVGRVTVTRGLEMPTPPPRIEADPERLAMWQQAFERKMSGTARQRVVAVGCGEQITYACWEWPAPGGQGRDHHGEARSRDAVIGSSCSEIPGGAQPSALR